MRRESYWADSARLVFGDRTVFWKVPVLALLDSVPVIGSVATLGYMMVMMRDTAWGAREQLPSFEDAPAILSQGLRGFVVSLVWSLLLVPLVAVVFIVLLANSMPQIMATGVAPQLPPWFGIAVALPVALIAPFIYAAELRASIYTDVRGGLSLSGVRRLIAADGAAFRRVAAMALAMGLIGVALALPQQAISTRVHSAILATGLVLGFGFISRLVTIPLWLMIARAYGLWAADCDVASWPPLQVQPVPFSGRQPLGLDEGAPES